MGSPSSFMKDLEVLKARREELRRQIGKAEASDDLSQTEKLLRNSKEDCLDVDDVLDEWEYKLLRAQIEGGSPNILTADPQLGGPMAHQIGKMKGKLTEVNARGTIPEGGDARQRSQPSGLAPTSSLQTDDHDFKVKMVKECLVHKCIEEPLKVKMVKGLGLAGKTTLARAVYKDPQDKEHFAGVSSRGDVNLTVLLRSFTEALYENKPTKDAQTLIRFLKGKRCFLILEVLHDGHLNVWDALKMSLIDLLVSSCSKRSVVLVTIVRDKSSV